MKNSIIILSTFIIIFLTHNIQAQNVNWNWLDKQKHHYAHLNLGYDFGVTTQIGYDYLITIKRPVLFTTDISLPMGKNLLNDFKFRLGGQVEMVSYKNFIASLKLFGNLKRHETKLVQMTNFGAETSFLMGYYKEKWHLAGEVGFNKPFSSHVKHAGEMKKNFPSIQDGWFESLGGHFYYGLQAGKSITNKIDLSFRIGATNASGNHKNAIISKYAQLGLVYKF